MWLCFCNLQGLGSAMSTSVKGVFGQSLLDMWHSKQKVALFLGCRPCCKLAAFTVRAGLFQIKGAWLYLDKVFYATSVAALFYPRK